jgi:hypothetical protein
VGVVDESVPSQQGLKLFRVRPLADHFLGVDESVPSQQGLKQLGAVKDRIRFMVDESVPSQQGLKLS